jgi:hypothetical protein
MSGPSIVAAVMAREGYDEMIRLRVAPELKNLGFRRLRNRFVRRVGRSWQIIDFQASQFGSRDDVSFTINLAVALDELPRAAGTWDATKPPSEYHAQLRERIGNLMEAGEDHWWPLDESTDAAQLALADELIGIVRRVGLPWLESTDKP